MPGQVTPRSSAESGATGRVRHDEKITIYLSAEELVALEQAKLTLRAEHHLSADRGLIVRTAIAMALDQLESTPQRSELVRRLGGQ
jgi:hypothetical protein